MNAAMLLCHAAGVVEHREQMYGPAAENFANVAARWSLVLGDPSHLDSIVDVAGCAACLREVTTCTK